MPNAQSLTFATLHSLIARLSPLKACTLAFVCGVITLFAFAPFFFWPIYVLSITLMVWLIDGARIKTRGWRRSVFFRGWLFGAGFTLSSMHWLAAPFLVEPEKHLMYIWMPLILMPAGLGLFFGVATLLAGHFWSRKPGRIFVFVLAVSLTEYLRGIIFGGFPWNWPGTIWEPGLPVSQLASIFGAYGLSVLTLLLAASPAALADFDPKNGVAGRVFPVFLAVIVFGSGWGWGSQRLDLPEPDKVMAVRLVDIAIPQDEKYPVYDFNVEEESRARADLILNAYLSATGSDLPDEPRLIIWPESPIPVRFVDDRDSEFMKAVPLIQDPDALDAIYQQLGDRELITGTPRYERFDEDGNLSNRAFNSLALLTNRNNSYVPAEIYDKRRLVPFGELAAADFIPFGQQISGLLPQAMQQAARAGYTPGDISSSASHLKSLSTGETFLPLICYEALFPNLVRKDARNADFLVNISLDHWFGGQIGPQQHFINASFRSIETGRPMIRVANQGVTGVVDPTGRLVLGNVDVSTDHGWTVKVTDVTVDLNKVNTIYNSDFNYALTLMFVFIALFGVMLSRKVKLSA